MTSSKFDPLAYGNVTMQKIMLERFQLHARRVLETRKTALNGLRIELMELCSSAVGEMALDMSAYVWSQRLQDETVSLSVSYPSTWWQAFKQRYFPTWALTRWPVTKTIVSRSHRFRTLALFPGYKYESPSRCGEHHINCHGVAVLIAALRAKLHSRGPLGFARDAAELAASCYLIAAWQAVAGTSVLIGGVVAAPFLAWDLLARPRTGERPHRCDADCAAGRMACGQRDGGAA